MQFRIINSYLETPLTDEQEEWLVLNEENRARADEIIAAGVNGTLISAFPFVKYPDALAEHIRMIILGFLNI